MQRIKVLLPEDYDREKVMNNILSLLILSHLQRYVVIKLTHMTMKRLIIFFVIICSTMLATAQISIGFSAGSNLSTMSIQRRDLSTFRIKPIFGYNFNFIAEYKINPNLSLNSGLTFSQKGFKQSIRYFYSPEVDSTAEMTSKLNYLEIPIYLKFNTNLNKGNFFYGIGPYFSYGFKGKVTTDITGRNYASYTDKITWSKNRYFKSDLVEEYGYTNIKSFDLGIGNLIGIKYNHLMLTVSYQYSLRNIMWEYYQDEKMSNSTLSLSVGYLF